MPHGVIAGIQSSLCPFDPVAIKGFDVGVVEVEASITGLLQEEAKAGIDGVPLARPQGPDPLLRYQSYSGHPPDSPSHRGVGYSIVAMDSDHPSDGRMGQRLRQCSGHQVRRLGKKRDGDE
jgi:hypothetical protein